MFLNSRALGDELASVVRAARQAGVTRLVALSAINADDDFSRQPSRFRGDRNREVEQLAVDSGLEWVSLRPTVFVTNFFGMWAPQIQAGDVVAGPYARRRRPHRSSTATSPRSPHTPCSPMTLSARRIPLTGPQALTNTELVDVIGGVLGRRLPTARSRQNWCGNASSAMGFPAEFADAYIALLAETVESRHW